MAEKKVKEFNREKFMSTNSRGAAAFPFRQNAAGPKITETEEKSKVDH